ncbi:MAG: protein kinase [Thermoanaerobaculia bacterium]|nr:protein kinase [Thermoanaerobaculia bacterium]
MIGSRLGPYEITAKLGEGGMGEVWRARDRTLGRDVAVKVLPAAFSVEPERLARFEREARLLASLNHPNIAQVYGLESTGATLALIMELVAGATLAERMERGPLRLDECLAVARQIAEALEEAHEKGIVHRDLKPQNIKAPVDGKVKVLDFGLAKAIDPVASGEVAADDLARSPTLSLDATREGMILGTAAYMAPEQARGGAVDKRADIWAFGVVLYEMLTGERLFAEGSVVDTLSAVIRKEIDFARLPPAAPAPLRELVRRCLERDPLRRLRDIGEARVLLERLAAAPAPVVSGRGGPPSVAVLPFVNMSADPENEFFADGITEDVIAHLARIRSLKVISRTSVMKFKQRDRSLREIGDALGAATLLEGSVRRAGNRVRIVAQLVDGASDEHLWAETYDRDLTDIFAIQSDVALSIAEALRAELTKEERARVARRPTEDLAAYEHYLKGRAWMNRYTVEGFRRSLAEFEAAAACDPGFALAHASIAQIHTEHGISGIVGLSPEESLRSAKEAVARALALDPELPEAHGISALIRFSRDYDWEAAERDFQRSLELGPGVAETHDHYSWMLSSMERYDEALREVRIAKELDPLLIQSDLGTALLRAGRYEEALAEARRAVVGEPGSARCHSNLGWALIFTGDPAAGLASLEHAVALSPGATLFLSQLGQAAAMTGDAGRARTILAQLDELAAREFVSPYHFAYVHAGLGEADAALDYLEQAFARRSGAIYGIKGSFLFRSLRGQPRFEALLRKMNLA